jgi:hypothetical protein
MEEGEGEVHMNENDEGNVEGEVTFGFPIVDPTTNVQMKNIPHLCYPISMVW